MSGRRDKIAERLKAAVERKKTTTGVTDEDRLAVTVLEDKVKELLNCLDVDRTARPEDVMEEMVLQGYEVTIARWLTGKSVFLQQDSPKLGSTDMGWCSPLLQTVLSANHNAVKVPEVMKFSQFRCSSDAKKSAENQLHCNWTDVYDFYLPQHVVMDIPGKNPVVDSSHARHMERWSLGANGTTVNIQTTVASGGGGGASMNSRKGSEQEDRFVHHGASNLNTVLAALQCNLPSRSKEIFLHCGRMVWARNKPMPTMGQKAMLVWIDYHNEEAWSDIFTEPEARKSLNELLLYHVTWSHEDGDLKDAKDGETTGKGVTTHFGILDLSDHTLLSNAIRSPTLLAAFGQLGKQFMLSKSHREFSDKHQCRLPPGLMIVSRMPSLCADRAVVFTTGLDVLCLESALSPSLRLVVNQLWPDNVDISANFEDSWLGKRAAAAAEQIQLKRQKLELPEPQADKAFLSWRKLAAWAASRDWDHQRPYEIAMSHMAEQCWHSVVLSQTEARAQQTFARWKVARDSLVELVASVRFVGSASVPNATSVLTSNLKSTILSAFHNNVVVPAHWRMPPLLSSSFSSLPTYVKHVTYPTKHPKRKKKAAKIPKSTAAASTTADAHSPPEPALSTTALTTPAVAPPAVAPSPAAAPPALTPPAVAPSPPAPPAAAASPPPPPFPLRPATAVLSRRPVAAPRAAALPPRPAAAPAHTEPQPSTPFTVVRKQKGGKGKNVHHTPPSPVVNKKEGKGRNVSYKQTNAPVPQPVAIRPVVVATKSAVIVGGSKLPYSAIVVAGRKAPVVAPGAPAAAAPATAAPVAAAPAAAAPATTTVAAPSPPDATPPPASSSLVASSPPPAATIVAAPSPLPTVAVPPPPAAQQQYNPRLHYPISYGPPPQHHHQQQTIYQQQNSWQPPYAQAPPLQPMMYATPQQQPMYYNHHNNSAPVSMPLLPHPSLLPQQQQPLLPLPPHLAPQAESQLLPLARPVAPPPPESSNEQQDEGLAWTRPLMMNMWSVVCPKCGAQFGCMTARPTHLNCPVCQHACKMWYR